MSTQRRAIRAPVLFMAEECPTVWLPRISWISSSVDRHLGYSAFGDREWRCCGRMFHFSPCMFGSGFATAVTVTKCDGVGGRGGWEGKPRCPGEVAACPSGDTGRPLGWWGWGRRGRCIRQGADPGSRGPGCSLAAGDHSDRKREERRAPGMCSGLKHLLPKPSQTISVPKAIVAQVADWESRWLGAPFIYKLCNPGSAVPGRLLPHLSDRRAHEVTYT